MRGMLRVLVGLLAVVMGVIILAVLAIWIWLRGSLPEYSGTDYSAKLRAKVSIERDSYAVPTVAGSTREEVAYGIGYAHGQDRFFQMDLLRRSPAGELAEILGPLAVVQDRRVRVHGFRRKANLAWEKMPEEEGRTLEYYVAGVNHGLESLRSKPWEYGLLKSEPRPWSPQDSILVLYAFYLDLQNNPGRDYARWIARKLLPLEVVELFDHPTNAWEASVDGSAIPIPEIPGPDTFAYLRANREDTAKAEMRDPPETQPGSNNWVVGSALSTTGYPILANDPHLTLNVPNNWYKLSYQYPRPETGEAVQAHGFSIPGAPGIVVGSTLSLAWGVTNAQIDTDDLIVLEEGENGYPEYKTSTGTDHIQLRREIIQVRGGEPITVDVPYTRWGPVIRETPDGVKLVRRWAAYHADAANTLAVQFDRCATVDEFLDMAHRANLPVQNYVVADSAGNIAYTLAGFVPDRRGADPYQAIMSSQADRIWNSKLDRANWPVYRNPANQRLWTANNRILGTENYRNLGSNRFAEFPRAYQIREKLLAKEKLSPDSMADIQHDNSVVFFLRWRELMLDTLSAMENPTRELERMEREVRAWDGWADPESTGFTLIRGFRVSVARDVLTRIFRPCLDFDPKGFDPFSFQFEEPLYRIVSQQPDHLLDSKYRSWQEALESVLQRLVIQVKQNGWEYYRWGNRNKANFRHPFSYSMPFLSFLLDMPRTEQAGAPFCPKVLNGSFCAGFRIVASPGKLEDSIFQLGCGQSGHFLSPHYRDLHSTWSDRDYLPLLPGPPIHTLNILPEKRGQIGLE